jgi:hypothetical protein
MDSRHISNLALPTIRLIRFCWTFIGAALASAGRTSGTYKVALSFNRDHS